MAPVKEDDGIMSLTSFFLQFAELQFGHFFDDDTGHEKLIVLKRSVHALMVDFMNTFERGMKAIKDSYQLVIGRKTSLSRPEGGREGDLQENYDDVIDDVIDDDERSSEYSEDDVIDDDERSSEYSEDDVIGEAPSVADLFTKEFEDYGSNDEDDPDYIPTDEEDVSVDSLEYASTDTDSFHDNWSVDEDEVSGDDADFDCDEPRANVMVVDFATFRTRDIRVPIYTSSRKVKKGWISPGESSDDYSLRENSESGISPWESSDDDLPRGKVEKGGILPRESSDGGLLPGETTNDDLPRGNSKESGIIPGETTNDDLPRGNSKESGIIPGETTNDLLQGNLRGDLSQKSSDSEGNSAWRRPSGISEDLGELKSDDYKQSTPVEGILRLIGEGEDGKTFGMKVDPECIPPGGDVVDGKRYLPQGRYQDQEEIGYKHKLRENLANLLGKTEWEDYTRANMPQTKDLRLLGTEEYPKVSYLGSMSKAEYQKTKMPRRSTSSTEDLDSLGTEEYPKVSYLSSMGTEEYLEVPYARTYRDEFGDFPTEVLDERALPEGCMFLTGEIRDYYPFKSE